MTELTAKEKLQQRFQSLKNEQKQKSLNTPKPVSTESSPISIIKSPQIEKLTEKNGETPQPSTDSPNSSPSNPSSPVKILIERHNSIDMKKKEVDEKNQSKDAKEIIPEQKVETTVNNYEVKKPKWNTKESVKKKFTEISQKKEKEQKKLEEEQKKLDEKMQQELDKKTEEDFKKEQEKKNEDFPTVILLQTESNSRPSTPPNGQNGDNKPRISVRLNNSFRVDNVDKKPEESPISPRMILRIKEDVNPEESTLLSPRIAIRKESLDQSHEESPQSPRIKVSPLNLDVTTPSPNRGSFREENGQDPHSFREVFGKGTNSLKKPLPSFRNPLTMDSLKTPVTPQTVIPHSLLPEKEKKEGSFIQRNKIFEELYIIHPEIEYEELLTPSELFLQDYQSINFSIEKKEVVQEDFEQALDKILRPPKTFLSWYELQELDLIIPEPISCVIDIEDIPTLSEEFLDPKEAEKEVDLTSVVDLVIKSEKPKLFKVEKLHLNLNQNRMSERMKTPQPIVPQTPKEVVSPQVLNLDTVRVGSDSLNPKMSGFMLINLDKKWIKRYFIIKGSYILGYEDESMSKEVDSILIQIANIENLPNDVAIKECQKQNVLKIITAKKIVYFHIENTEEFLTWGIQLRKAALRYTGATILVDKSGGGQAKSIQDALMKAKNLDKIVIKSGIYEETVIVTKLVCIEGKDVILKSKKGPCFTVTVNGAVKISGISCEVSETNCACILLKSGNLTLYGCEIRSGKEGGVQALSGSQLTMTKTLITGNSKYGIQMMTNTCGVFDRCHIGQNQGDGISFSPQVICMIVKSTFLQNEGYGLCFTGETYCISDHSTYVKNKLSGLISLNPKSVILLRKNEFLDNANYGCEFPTKKLEQNEFQITNTFTNNTKGIIKSL